jgi:alpha-glucosidase
MSETNWWRGCVIYQVYPRSYQDTSGTGVGDLSGVTRRLEHIASLGVDGIWISPFFKSPMKDFGYDVADYCDIDPLFGTLDDFRRLLDKAHNLNLKILIDMVWSHTSDQHAWFKESRRDRTNPKKDWYVWADPKPDGTPPNNWLSYFGGPAWTWDSRREQYYLHHFLKEQPTLNLWDKEVEQAIFDTAKFWLDMGVDGFRLDVAHAYLYDLQLRSNPAKGADDPWPTDVPSSNPMARQRRVHQMCVPENLTLIERIRAYVNQWPNRCLLGEAGGDDSEAVATSYVQTGKRFHMAYSFGLVGTDMTPTAITKAVIGVQSRIKDGWICWATSNHDFARPVTRLNPPPGLEHDAAILNMALGLSLRGSYCVYQGEELGLPQAQLSFDELQDPYDIMLYPEHVGRDGCRTPMPWQHDAPHGGFSEAAKTWLPVKAPHLDLAVDVQDNDDGSILNAYRTFLKLRQSTPALKNGEFNWLVMPYPLIGFLRIDDDGHQYGCYFNPTTEFAAPITVPLGQNELLFAQKCELHDQTLKLGPYGVAIIKH